MDGHFRTKSVYLSFYLVNKANLGNIFKMLLRNQKFKNPYFINY